VADGPALGEGQQEHGQAAADEEVSRSVTHQNWK
jgi:hypothetical protein